MSKRGLMDFTKGPEQDKGWFDSWAVSDTGANAGSSGGFDWGDALNIGATLVGGYIQDRGSQRANETTRQMTREEILARRESDRENLASQMQIRQDDYAREVTRGRNAISPYRQMYSGPAFEGVNPDGPIYNPLMESGHMFQELRKPPVVKDPAASTDGKPAAKPKKPKKKPWWKF